MVKYSLTISTIGLKFAAGVAPHFIKCGGEFDPHFIKSGLGRVLREGDERFLKKVGGLGVLKIMYIYGDLIRLRNIHDFACVRKSRSGA